MFVFLGLVAVTAACADDVPEGSFLERTRVLAVGALPAGDAARAWPQVGEETSLAWLVEGPGPLPPMSWSVAVCAAADAGCTADPFFVAQGSGMPEVSFVAPDAENLLVVAQVVPQDEPATELIFRLPVEKDAPNHHPTMGALTFDGRPWGEACEPARAGGEKIELRVASDGADREGYTDDEGVAKRETLRFSFFATAGEMDGQYRVVEADAAEETESVMKWTPPKVEDVPEGGIEVLFTVVLRDLRGGVDWTTRKVCVSK